MKNDLELYFASTKNCFIFPIELYCLFCIPFGPNIKLRIAHAKYGSLRKMGTISIVNNSKTITGRQMKQKTTENE